MNKGKGQTGRKKERKKVWRKETNKGKGQTNRQKKRKKWPKKRNEI